MPSSSASPSATPTSWPGAEYILRGPAPDRDAGGVRVLRARRRPGCGRGMARLAPPATPDGDALRRLRGGRVGALTQQRLSALPAGRGASSSGSIDAPIGWRSWPASSCSACSRWRCGSSSSAEASFRSGVARCSGPRRGGRGLRRLEARGLAAVPDAPAAPNFVSTTTQKRLTVAGRCNGPRYTQCPDVCPIMHGNSQRRAGSAAARATWRPLSVSVDPARDTPSAARRATPRPPPRPRRFSGASARRRS